MSNLGTIYQIDFKNGYKIKYPVVYENKSYWYCKVYGSDMLTWFSKNTHSYPAVIGLVSYLNNVEKYKETRANVFIYVAPHEKYNFDDFKYGLYDKLISEKNEKIKDFQLRIERIKNEIHEKQYEIDNYLPQKIDQLKIEIEDLKLRQKEVLDSENNKGKDN